MKKNLESYRDFKTRGRIFTWILKTPNRDIIFKCKGKNIKLNYDGTCFYFGDIWIDLFQLSGIIGDFNNLIDCKTNKPIKEMLD